MLSTGRTTVQGVDRVRRLAAKLALAFVVAAPLGVADLLAREAAIALAELPREARATQMLILSGGPFPYAKDGIVFGNRERLLPRRERGHYREYTVQTPGARDRGARRIVCGGAVAVRPEACFYTDDHYASFRLIVQ